MLTASIAVIVGLIVLVWGADRFVLGASATARNLGISPLIIGLTVVGLGTSAPEILVGSVAAWTGDPGIAVGNALGSNIANIALILGVTALIIPLTVGSSILRREYPLLLLATLICTAVLLDSDLSRIDAVILLAALGFIMYLIVSFALRERDSRPGETDPMESDFQDEIPSDMSQGKATAWLVLGLVSLLISSRILVWGATDIATALGVSDLVIGLTIVAIGTSLPELAASIASAMKNEPDIAIGNVIGSNMFNSLAVLGVPGMIHPISLSGEILTRDLPLMIGLTVALFFMAYGSGGPGRINRVEAGVLLAVFLGYQYHLLSLATI